LIVQRARGDTPTTSDAVTFGLTLDLNEILRTAAKVGAT
jgi:hypothetical protein